MLYREHCTIHAQNGFMVKDLSKLGRRIENVIIIDNSPNSYFFQPENSMPSISWIKDRTDFELRDMVPFLIKLSSNKVTDVRQYLSKVIDYTDGTRTPVFNKKKASQIMKLMGNTDKDV